MSIDTPGTPPTLSPPDPSVSPAADAPEPGLSLRTAFLYGVAGSLGVLTVVLGAMALLAVRTVLVQVLIAAFIAVSLDPAVRFMIGRGVKRSHAVLVILLFAAIFVGLMLWVVTPPLVHEVPKLVGDFPGYLNSLRTRSQSLRTLEDRFNLQPKINEYASHLPGKLGAQALTFGRRFLGALFSGLLIMALTIYLMADLPRLRRTAVRLFPRRYRPGVTYATNVMIDKVGGYMIGNLIISAFAGVATFIACEALRVPFAIPLAVFVALTDLIPLVGATFGAVVTVIVALATTDLWRTAAIAAFFLLYQQLENYLIAPRVLRNAVQMPALEVLLAALLGGSVLGLVGALMAIPLAAAIKVIATSAIRAREEEARAALQVAVAAAAGAAGAAADPPSRPSTGPPGATLNGDVAE